MRPTKVQITIEDAPGQSNASMRAFLAKVLLPRLEAEGYQLVDFP